MKEVNKTGPVRSFEVVYRRNASVIFPLCFFVLDPQTPKGQSIAKGIKMTVTRRSFVLIFPTPQRTIALPFVLFDNSIHPRRNARHWVLFLNPRSLVSKRNEKEQG